MMEVLDQELTALIAADPGPPPAPAPDPDEMGIDEAGLNGARPAHKAQPEGIAIVTAQEFAAVKEAGADPLLGGPGQAVIPEGGDVMLYGDGGASKTTLSIDLACHIAAGNAWLGIPVPKAARVLLIEAEGPRPLFRQKLATKLEQWAGSDLSDRLLVHETPWADFSFPEADGVAAQIAEQEIDVLIVGPLTRVGMDELGTLQQVRDFMGHVARFRRQTGRRLTVFLVHHQNKGGSVSGAWEGASDTLLHAQVHKQGKTTLTFQKARWASAWHKRALELGWTEGEGFEVVGEDERDYADEAEALLVETGGWMTVGEISRAREKGGIGANKDMVREALEADPQRFSSRTGDDAKAVGRSARATVWQLAQASEPVEPVGDSPGDSQTGLELARPLRGQGQSEPVPSTEPALAQASEPVPSRCQAELLAAVSEVTAAYNSLPSSVQGRVGPVTRDGLDSEIGTADAADDAGRALAAIRAWRGHWLATFEAAQ